MADYIPEEVVVEILSRLPVEPVVRFTSVCKSWYSLITGPNFISFHSKRMASTNKSLLLVRDYNEQSEYRFSLHFDDEPFEETKTLDFPFASCFDNSTFDVIGCANGVVCLGNVDSTYLIILWNPTIRKYITLPDPIFGCRDLGFMLGFGFDAASNDFKVVRIVYPSEDQQKRDVTMPHNAEVYEPRVGSWRSVDTKGWSCIIDDCSPRQAFLHGTVHWVVFSENALEEELNDTNLIVSFDLTREAFGKMKLPDNLLVKKPLRHEFWVTVLGESLALIHDSWSDNSNGSGVCCIWVLKQYGVPDSWTKQFSVDVTECYWTVYGFRRNGEALVIQMDDSDPPLHQKHLLFSVEPKSKQVKYFRAFRDWTSFYVDHFVGSLALLGVKGESLAKGKSSVAARAISKRPPNEGVEDEDRYLETFDRSVSEDLAQFVGQFVVHSFNGTPC